MASPANAGDPPQLCELLLREFSAHCPAQADHIAALALPCRWQFQAIRPQVTNGLEDGITGRNRVDGKNPGALRPWAAPYLGSYGQCSLPLRMRLADIMQHGGFNHRSPVGFVELQRLANLLRMVPGVGQVNVQRNPTADLRAGIIPEPPAPPGTRDFRKLMIRIAGPAYGRVISADLAMQHHDHARPQLAVFDPLPLPGFVIPCPGGGVLRFQKLPQAEDGTG